MRLGRLESLRIRGFRSLADVEIEDLPDVAVMIGANGSGKSNLIRFFEMISRMLHAHGLAEFVERHGGADDQLFGGAKITPRLNATLTFRTIVGRKDYRFALEHAQPDRFMFAEEAYRFGEDPSDAERDWHHLGSGHREAQIPEAKQSRDEASESAKAIARMMLRVEVYQFHDTSDHSPMKQKWDADDICPLRGHGGNLAAVLHALELDDRKRFDLICYQIGRVLPVFDRFRISERYGKVSLRWKAKGTDKTFGAHLTSDGSLRFFALVTLLNLPADMLPDILLLDEPELGLHPSAIGLIAAMIKQVAVDRQVIVATQSPLLVDAFELDTIVVLDLVDGRTECRRLDSADYRQWLDEFSTGQLWEKNLLGGYP